MNISILGFGRIGRDLLRQTLNNDLINIVSISDIADKENLLYLLKYDTIYGKLDAEIETTDTGFKINGKNIVFNDWKDASEASWQDLETDILIVSTGRKQDLEEVNEHIAKGCKRVLIASTPKSGNDIQIYVPGANDAKVDFNNDIISLGSNTANAVAPLLKIINEKYGVERAFLTTVHGYSNSNRLADVAGEGFRLNRAAGENIIPAITKSSEVIETVLPFMKDKVASSSMTVPVPDGSTVDLTIDIKTEATSKDINQTIEEAIKHLPYNKVLDITFDPIVSSDVVGNSHSGIIDGLATMDINNNKIKILIWFDNGWGYSARIIDTITKLSESRVNE
ncbi:MAG: type I glyceraldehyde-3-phosphate dehydrogenase [Candidatus Actinomarina sp.]|jgi:glyceraldehyde 3-phosphate dehydrogenase|nr:glyceraldehyde 3-phosphate dehydrogenase NAD-binding domain-containing protein [Candidatus Actinomarina sp.]